MRGRAAQVRARTQVRAAPGFEGRLAEREQRDARTHGEFRVVGDVVLDEVEGESSMRLRQGLRLVDEDHGLIGRCSAEESLVPVDAVVGPDDGAAPRDSEHGRQQHDREAANAAQNPDAPPIQAAQRHGVSS